MMFAPCILLLPDERACILRPPSADDAAAMLAWQRRTMDETPFTLATAADYARVTLDDETLYLTRLAESPMVMMIVAEIDGEIVGSGQLHFGTHLKQRHLADVGLTISKRWWGHGIGTQMLRMMLDSARDRQGISTVELEYIDGNERARALYKRLGFREVGVHPGAIMQPNGTMCALHLMQLDLKQTEVTL